MTEKVNVETTLKKCQVLGYVTKQAKFGCVTLWGVMYIAASN